MAQLAIKGHETRGKEVIEILEMLGGENSSKYFGDDDSAVYSIEGQEIVIYELEAIKSKEYNVFTLEEFLEKFPYKVGDKAKLDGWPCIITEMSWGYDDVVYSVKGVDFSKRVCSKDLQPYKEAPMYLNGKANKQSDEIKKTIEPVKEIMEETDTMGHTSELNLNHPVFKGSNEIEIIIPDGWEFKQRDNKMFGVRKQPKYPKTYKDCCDVLGLSTMDNDAKGYKAYLIIRFQELLIARDAYWKIAGEEMGLGKPWEADWNKSSQFKDVIICRSNNIIKYAYAALNTTLAFPTEEIRDAFYENFKDLIEECKEIL